MLDTFLGVCGSAWDEAVWSNTLQSVHAIEYRVVCSVIAVVFFLRKTETL